MTEPSLQALRDARDALDAVIDEIREVDGFSSFLAEPTFEDVATAAAQEPVVYLAAAELGGLALVVRGLDVTTIDLPELTRDAVETATLAYQDAYAAYLAEPDGGAPAWEAALDDVTGWLWTAAMGEVIADLERTAPADGDGPPRAVLIPGGLLGLLPLHAAARPDPDRPTGREYVLDRVQVAYAPNARSLTAARDVACQVRGRRVFAVAAPPRASALPMAVTEARAAARAFPDGHDDRNPDAVTFLWMAAEADIVHVVCHGVADLAEPLNSRLELAPGEEVTLATLMAQELRVRLAVLSACETLLPGTELPDEVISLPTGLIQAGAAGVIASMWAVPDLPSAVLMIEMYRHLRELPDDPGAALRTAQIWVRDTPVREQLERYRAAATTRGAWPPPAIAKAVKSALTAAALAAGTNERPRDGMSSWAAFAHIGV